MLDYKEKGFFAQVPGMMEEICEQELIEIGAINTKTTYRGIYFQADKKTLYKINYTSRMISRVLAPLFSFHCSTSQNIIKFARKVKWEDVCSLNKTFAISSSLNNSTITNSLYAAQSLKDGIADYFRAKYGRRPNVDTVNPDARFFLHIEKNKAVVSLDTSGESLHKRGYRLLSGAAPMQETLAAAIIRLSGWNGQNTLLDPMCGSGTFLCEALMYYCRIPAQNLRKKFGFFNLPDFDRLTWKKVKSECDEKIRSLPRGILRGSDKSQKTLEIAKDNLSRLPYSDAVDLSCNPFQHIKSFENGTIIVNPPYGIRLGEIEQVKA
ncbi:MAG: hypothetical protein JXA68_08330, partial [Ignavibacteriales bacterium]|nr:hypothetical protein [Ignavibacteriales bacterium]